MTVPKPVCSTCNDTHRMMLHREGHEDREVMCTRCPTPCERCRSRGPGGGGGPYCAQTPCLCACHRPSSAPKSDTFKLTCLKCGRSLTLEQRLVTRQDMTIDECALCSSHGGDA